MQNNDWTWNEQTKNETTTTSGSVDGEQIGHRSETAVLSILDDRRAAPIEQPHSNYESSWYDQHLDIPWLQRVRWSRTLTLSWHSNEYPYFSGKVGISKQKHKLTNSPERRRKYSLISSKVKTLCCLRLVFVSQVSPSIVWEMPTIPVHQGEKNREIKREREEPNELSAGSNLAGEGRQGPWGAAHHHVGLFEYSKSCNT